MLVFFIALVKALCKSKNRVINISAPGKMVLCGEHAVMYGYSAISFAIKQRMFVSIKEKHDKTGTVIKSEFGVLNIKDSSSANNCLEDFPEWGKTIVFLLQTIPHSDLEIEITSNIKNYGFGASGALFSCISCGLLLLNNSLLTKQELLQKTLEIYFSYCKKNNCLLSGIDVTTSIVGGIIFYSSRGKIVESLPEWFFKNYKIFAIWTGYKTDTEKAAMIANNVTNCKSIYIKIDQIVNEIKQMLLQTFLFEKKNKFKSKTENSLLIFKKFFENQNLLNQLQIVDKNIIDILKQCEEQNVCAKISGSGLGDSVIAICENKKKFKIRKYKKIEIKIDINGVKYDFKQI